jgi:hypothetical protein
MLDEWENITVKRIGGFFFFKRVILEWKKATPN